MSQKQHITHKHIDITTMIIDSNPMSMIKSCIMSDDLGMAVKKGAEVLECTESSFIRQALIVYMQQLGDPNIDFYLEEHKKAVLDRDMGRRRKKTPSPEASDV